MAREEADLVAEFDKARLDVIQTDHFTAAYILGSVYGGMPRWCFGIGPQGIGTVGMLLNFAVTLALTPLFPPPSAKVRALIDRIREPEGAGPAVIAEA